MDSDPKEMPVTDGTGVAVKIGEDRYLVDPHAHRLSLPAGLQNVLGALEREYGSGGAFDQASERQTQSILEQFVDDKASLEELLTTGSGIPFFAAMMGDILINPSTVSPLTFRKMMETDDVIYHALDYNSSSVVDSIGEYSHPNPDIERTIRYMFGNLRRGFDTVVRDMAMAVGMGFSVHSLKWDYDKKVGGNIIVDAKPLPQSTILFRADAEGYIKEDGVGQFVYNAYFQNVANLNSLGFWNWGFPASNIFPSGTVGAAGGCDGWSGGPVDAMASGGDLEYPFRIPWYTPIGLVWINRRNVMVYSHYGVTNQMNPYGKAALRAVYGLWLQTLALQEMRNLAISRRSSPLLLVYCNQNTPLQNADASQRQNQQPIYATEAAKRAMEDVNSVSTVVLPGMPGTMFQVDKVDIQGNIDFFQKIENDLNDRKKTALGVPTHVTAGGDGASYALAYMHGQSNSRIVATNRNNILSCLIRQVVWPVIEENFTPEEHGGERGKFDDKQISVDERLKSATLYQTAINSGLAFNTRRDDLNVMREGLGFGPIDEEEDLEAMRQGNLMVPAAETPDSRDVGDMTETPYNHRS